MLEYKSRALLVLSLVLYAGLVAWIDARNSPNPDETAHLAAGVAIWQSERFDVYPVNPPLTRIIAALPVACGCFEGNWKCLQRERHDTSWAARPEWSMGIGLVRDNPAQAMRFFAVPRWACLPLGVVGGYFCWRWAGELYGNWAAALALSLWCFSPNILAWSATICPDVAAASLGIAACYFFWQWLKEPGWLRAVVTGIVLGAVELTKFTWILLFAVWPFVWLLWLWRRHNITQLGRSRQALQLAGILAIGVYVINLGYSFSGTFTRLGDYTFVSRTLAGTDSAVDGGHGGNRFAESCLRYIPIPLPRDYVEGVDLQKVDFERGLPSYLFGHWSQHGWWYYYIVCAALKVPLGIWAIGLLVVGARIGYRLLKRQREAGHIAHQADWLEEVVLLLPAIVLIVFVSSQTGFSCHFRYVLPAFPFVFVWISSAAQGALSTPRTIGIYVAGALAWMLASSFSVYPHSMSYFNELAGGPMGGSRYLLGANIDWGQDILYLRRWCERHPEATPLHVAFGNPYSDALLGLGDRAKNLDAVQFASQDESSASGEPQAFGPTPGWYAVSIGRIHASNDRYEYFRGFTPLAKAGYSIYIYHITLDEANQVRREMMIPELAEILSATSSRGGASTDKPRHSR